MYVMESIKYTYLKLPGRACSVVHDILFPSFSIIHRRFYLSLEGRYHPAVDLCTSWLGIHMYIYHAVFAIVSGRSLLHLCFQQ